MWGRPVWLASGVRPGASLAVQVFLGHPPVSVIYGDWRDIYRHGPYDPLVLDGGGQGKSGEEPADPHRLLHPGGRWSSTT